MKRLYTFVALLGLVIGTLLTGCSPSDESSTTTTTTTDTNATTSTTTTNQ